MRQKQKKTRPSAIQKLKQILEGCYSLIAKFNTG